MREIKRVKGIEQKRLGGTVILGCLLFFGSCMIADEGSLDMFPGVIDDFFGIALPVIGFITGIHCVIMAILRSQNIITLYDTKVHIEAMAEPFYKGGRLHMEIPYDKIDSISVAQTGGGMLSPENLCISMVNGQSYTFAIQDLQEIIVLLKQMCKIDID